MKCQQQTQNWPLSNNTIFIRTHTTSTSWNSHSCRLSHIKLLHIYIYVYMYITGWFVIFFEMVVFTLHISLLFIMHLRSRIILHLLISIIRIIIYCFSYIITKAYIFAGNQMWRKCEKNEFCKASDAETIRKNET